MNHGRLIEDCTLLGDAQSAALVRRDGGGLGLDQRAVNRPVVTLHPISGAVRWDRRRQSEEADR